MKLSARNNLKGKVVDLKIGQVNVEVDIQLSGGDTITSVITKESCQVLGLKIGQEAYAIMKASSIIVAVD